MCGGWLRTASPVTTTNNRQWKTICNSDDKERPHAHEWSVSCRPTDQHRDCPVTCGIRKCAATLEEDTEHHVCDDAGQRVEPEALWLPRDQTANDHY